LKNLFVDGNRNGPAPIVTHNRMISGEKTRKKRGPPIGHKSRKFHNKSIQHHHLLLRMEMRDCPAAKDAKEAEILIRRIVNDIRMKMLDKPHVYYVKRPAYNEGLTAIVPIQTSHIAFHFWKRPETKILKSPKSRCLLEFDLYTCGALSGHQLRHVLHHLSHYGPTHVDLTVLNRKWSLSIDRHLKWSDQEGLSWAKWVDSIV